MRPIACWTSRGEGRAADAAPEAYLLAAGTIQDPVALIHLARKVAEGAAHEVVQLGRLERLLGLAGLVLGQRRFWEGSPNLKERKFERFQGLRSGKLLFKTGPVGWIDQNVLKNSRFRGRLWTWTKCESWKTGPR
jgi:hypothetical protein